MLSFFVIKLLFACLAACTSIPDTENPDETLSIENPKYLTHLHLTSNGLIVPFSSSNISLLSPLILKTPCTIFYSYSFWSGHAKHLIYQTQKLQRLAAHYEDKIAEGCINLAVAEINVPLEKESEVWKLISDRAYWDSLALVVAGNPMPVFLGSNDWEGIVESTNECLRQSKCGLKLEEDDVEKIAHNEL